MFNYFLKEIEKRISKTQIIQDELLRYAYSTDASLYRMVPKLVLVVKTEDEVKNIINIAYKYDVKLTFRAAGTSLSGQAVTDQVLVVLAKDSWLKYSINECASEIKLETGIIGADANNYLKAYRKQIGPDPGSINTAKIGGIIANNSSGMCCGTAKNSYSTIKSIRAILSDGTVFDSSNENELEKFKKSKKTLLGNIESIRNKIVNNSNISTFIKKKFAIKNTSGYSLNAFLDFTDPIKILERLMVGSEGTLGFISDVTLRTVDNHEYKSLNFIYGKLEDLTNLTISISNLGVSSVELLDYLSLQSVSGDKDIKKYLVDLPNDGYAAILIAIEAENENELQNKVVTLNQTISKFNIYSQIGFTSDENIMSTIWKARGGILPTIAGQRPLGSTVIIEDVAVEIQLLPQLIEYTRRLFDKYDFKNAAIFGHVLSGNIHFVITPDFSNPVEVTNYDKFMQEFTNIIVYKFHGSLKAEHGSGRNISPFAIVEWGQECLDIMWEIKGLFDPKFILNPDVKLTRDNTLHIKHLKDFTAVDDKVDKCMECGFCEPVCPSRKLSLTPRQRITVARKMQTLPEAEKQIWQKKYNYYGVDTCATTGMCKTVCPVKINTGEFILNKKTKQSARINHSKEIESARTKVKLGSIVASTIGANNLQKLTKIAHNTFKSIPIYLDSMPKAQSYNFENNEVKQDAIILVPACPNRIFGQDTKYGDYSSKLILEKLGFAVNFVENPKDSCCGQVYHSKCNSAQQKTMTTDISSKIAGAKTAIIDNSSCSGFAKDNSIDLIDINKFIVENINKKNIIKKYKKIALHIDCSTSKHLFNPKYINILKLCSEEIIVPEGISCCGFAGDKGFTIPELNASSLSNLSTQVAECEVGVTFNRTCQIGLSHHSKIRYVSFVELMLDCLK